MTPSTSLGLEGFLRGLQPNLMWLASAIIAIVVLVFVVRWLIGHLEGPDGLTRDEAFAARRWTSRFAWLFLALTLVGFGWNAATYATNEIPRAELDRSAIDRAIESNINR